MEKPILPFQQMVGINSNWAAWAAVSQLPFSREDYSIDKIIDA